MQSLAAYILILISKYEKNKSELTKKVDMWINIVLLVTRAAFNVAYIFFEISYQNNHEKGIKEKVSLFYHSIIGLNIFNDFYTSKLFLLIYLTQISLSYLITIDTEFKFKKGTTVRLIFMTSNCPNNH
ncbi:uncharacterized protein OCT59_002025 [Rhizophagus irregularis]|uniref:uncharacterized protein n=1 Tax=Rhizophagus irregularis TaxID=588596 RepID=UPI003322E102|nr:hypothetical protein OCT59_002025 [Rhizophagus irregularis]